MRMRMHARAHPHACGHACVCAYAQGVVHACTRMCVQAAEQPDGYMHVLILTDAHTSVGAQT